MKLLRQPPGFWRAGGGRMVPALLWPAARIVARITARRVAQPGWRAPVPVICCGNAGLGGAGKTTLVLDLAARLRARGIAVHLLTRGYGGTARGPLRVDPGHHTADQVGDEALLLAAAAPTWLGADRACTARLAIADGAAALILDDGFQNPTLEKNFSFLVIDGATGFGNGHVLPAGPLREPVAAAAARAGAAVMIGADDREAGAALPPGLPVLRAILVPGTGIAAVSGRRVLAFAGIGRPEKFFAMLETAGFDVADRVSFPDHHRFSATDLARLAARAAALQAVAVTTPKDFVRIPSDRQRDFTPIGVGLAWQDAAALDAILDRVLAGADAA